MRAKVLLLYVLSSLYFDSHSHSLHRAGIYSVRVYHILCMK